jgi:hypothetical protein
VSPHGLHDSPAPGRCPFGLDAERVGSLLGLEVLALPATAIIGVVYNLSALASPVCDVPGPLANRRHCEAGECEVESAPNPAAIRNSTLLLPAISQNLPCNTRNLSLLLVVARTCYKLLKPLEDLQELGLALPAFYENLPAIRPRDRFASDCILSHAVVLCGVISGCVTPPM